MSAKRLLVCGATGFIGRNLVEYYAGQDGYEVTGTYLNSEQPTVEGVRWVRADLTNASEVDALLESADIVIQAAATTSGAKDIVNKPYYHVTDNALMNSLLLRASFDHEIENFVFFSCSVMYPSSDTPLKESDFDANAELFRNYFGVGWTKVYVEKMCEFYSRIGKTRYTVLRHSNIYGPHDKFDLERSHVFGATMTKVLTNTSGELMVWGSGEEKRDLLYIDDLVDFVQKAVVKQETPFELVNVGCGHAVSVKSLVEQIIAASGKDLRIEHDLSQPTLKTSLALDASRAKELFGWEPSTSLEEGIRRTMAWYRETEPVPLPS